MTALALSIISSLINSAIGFFLYYRTKNNDNKDLKKRDGYLIVISSWIFMSLFGMLPYIITGQIPSMHDAFFETVSGYTTTGATIITNLDESPKSILLWRAIMQWLGGIGIVVMAITILPLLKVGGMQLFKMEGPDTVSYTHLTLPTNREV